jgi:hypothetical protein
MRNESKPIDGYLAIETWDGEVGAFDNEGYTIIKHAAFKKNSGTTSRLSGGFSFFLSEDTTKAWERAGCVLIDDIGPRVCAIKLLYTDEKGKDVTIFWGAAYAPTSDATTEEQDEYFDQLQVLIDRTKDTDVLTLSGDFNASLGIRTDDRDKVLGNFGIDHRNRAGDRLHDFLSSNELCSAGSFFQKRQYGTWSHPCSGKPHQLDYWFVRQRQRIKCTNAGRCKNLTVKSDHAPTECNIFAVRNLRRRPTRNNTARINRERLHDAGVEKAFQDTVVERCDFLKKES